jgi:predicted component of type VI protein secretion system
MKSLPLTFGSGPNADMRVDDAGGLIAAEEARVWVQRGRLVYHKLTTLSAMATEGVTAGWQFLNDGEELRVGPYRLIFQLQQQEEEESDAEPMPDRLPQEHGMALRQSFGLTELDRNPDLRAWADEQGPSALPMGSPPAPVDSPPEAETQIAADSTDDSSDEPSKPASSWDLAPAEPASSEWEVDDTGSGAGAWAIEDTDEPPRPAQDGDDSDEQSAAWDADPSGQPAEWGPTLLEPKSADWLVEQSEPVDDGVGRIVQPDAWSGFVSGDGDGDSPAPESGANDDDESDERAWGT